MDSVGAAVHVICFPGRATEDWTSAVLILQMNTRMFVSYIETTMYLKLRNVNYIFYILYEIIAICVLGLPFISEQSF